MMFNEIQSALICGEMKKKTPNKQVNLLPDDGYIVNVGEFI